MINLSDHKYSRRGKSYYSLPRSSIFIWSGFIWPFIYYKYLSFSSSNTSIVKKDSTKYLSFVRVSFEVVLINSLDCSSRILDMSHQSSEDPFLHPSQGMVYSPECYFNIINSDMFLLLTVTYFSSLCRSLDVPLIYTIVSSHPLTSSISYLPQPVNQTVIL